MKNSPGSPDELSALRLHKRLYDQASRLTRLGAWECDLTTERLTWTQGVFDLFELSNRAPLNRSDVVDLYDETSRVEMEARRADAIRSGRGFVLDAQIRTYRGRKRWMRLSADVAFERGRPVRLFGAKQDITVEKEAWDQLRTVSERDPLTGLANRRLFDARYAEMTRDAVNHSFLSGLVLVDLDHFKRINDRFGHSAGDECLRQAAVRLKRTLSEAAVIARIGGDEFAVLLRAPLGPSQIADLLRRTSRALCRPVFWNGTRLNIGASIGAAMLNYPYRRNVADLFAEADAALYTAKAIGRNALHIFGDILEPPCPIDLAEAVRGLSTAAE